jgi:hypothetical protein
MLDPFEPYVADDRSPALRVLFPVDKSRSRDNWLRASGSKIESDVLHSLCVQGIDEPEGEVPLAPFRGVTSFTRSARSMGRVAHWSICQGHGVPSGTSVGGPGQRPAPNESTPRRRRANRSEVRPRPRPARPGPRYFPVGHVGDRPVFARSPFGSCPQQTRSQGPLLSISYSPELARCKRQHSRQAASVSVVNGPTYRQCRCPVIAVSPSRTLTVFW